MNCEKISKEREGVANMAIDYCAGSLEPAQAAEFEHHLSECGDCTRVVAAQREVWESLGQLNVPEVSQDFDARLYARIAQEEAAPTWRKWLDRILKPATPVAIWKPALSMAALCAMLAVGLMLRAPAPVANTGQAVQMEATMQMEAPHVDIEQVANALDELDLLMPASAAPSVI
jgi:anti-sigma factor RsiW